MSEELKTNNRIHPEFPADFDGIQPVFPVWGGKKTGVTLGHLRCLAVIPTYVLCKDDDPERERLRILYFKERKDAYERIKAVYEKNCFVGTVFTGNKTNSKNSGRITKIAISEEKAYICYKASFEHVKYVEEMNKNSDFKMKPIKPGIMGLNSFLSGIAGGYIRIISIP